MVNQKKKSLTLGILAGASTGIFWGVPFLAPQVLVGYSSIDIAFGRFFFFGLMSLFFFRRGWSLFERFDFREKMKVLILSAIGFWFYSSVLFWSIQKTDGLISSLILGLLPVTIPLFSLGRKPGSLGFYFGLFLILAGLSVLVFYPLVNGESASGQREWPGVVGLFSCLAMWTAFAIHNSRFLQERPWISRRDFSSLMGILSLVCLVPVFFFSGFGAELGHRSDLGIFVMISAVLGLGSSWLANWLWNISSTRCPSGISGTLLVFETVFGLLYTFLYQKRPPHPFEGVAVSLSLSGVIFAVRAQIT